MKLTLLKAEKQVAHDEGEDPEELTITQFDPVAESVLFQMFFAFLS